MNILSRVPLALALSTLCISAPTIAAADQSIDHSSKTRVIWLEPNGVDDTSNLQGALDSCTDPGYPCKIKLASGVFHVAPIVATNFHGEVRGSGQDATIVQALTDRVLHLTEADPFFLFDPTPEEPWHTLVMFVEGNTVVSDLTVHVPAETKTNGWWGGCGGFKVPVLGVALGATGRHPMRFVVRNVSTIGAETGDADWPFTINGGMGVFGFMPGGSLDCTDFVPATGEFIFDSNYASTTLEGTDVWSVRDSNIRITRNTYEGIVLHGAIVLDASRSRAYIAYNNVSATSSAPIAMVQNSLVGIGFPVVHGESEYTVLGNHVAVQDGFAGIEHLDHVDGLAPSKLHISENVIQMSGTNFAAISVDRASRSSLIRKNRISGEADYGIFVNHAAACKIGLNDFSDLAEGQVDILLEEDTSNCRVHAFSGDTVEDLGTDNRIVYR